MTTDSSSFLEKVPAIIEASAKSPLALAALIILVLGFIAYIYFREAKEMTRTIIFLVLSVVAFLLLMAVLSGVRQSTDSERSPANQQQPGGRTGQGGTRPQPSAETRQPRVEVGFPVVAQGVSGPRGQGISITVPGHIKDAQGQSAQLVIHFTFPNGTPVWANQSETTYRANNGVVATGTGVFQITGDDYDLSASSIYIPYYAFNMMPSGYYNRIDLYLTASVYLNGVAMARSPSAGFYFMW
jgi:hypothetical protein